MFEPTLAPGQALPTVSGIATADESTGLAVIAEPIPPHQAGEESGSGVCGHGQGCGCHVCVDRLIQGRRDLRRDGFVQSVHGAWFRDKEFKEQGNAV